VTETVAYEITGKIGEIEFRKYPQMVLATVKDDGDDRGFNILFAYITGNNQTRTKIPMTAPVITSEKIPMTAPVISDERSMSFVMPEGKREEDMPVPLDPRVKITTIPPREFAVVQFKGYASREDVSAANVRLLEGLKEAGITGIGQPVLMRYNAPWTPGFLRRNEAGIEIKR
jgi:effector-binding domain-containing protein